MKPEGRENDDFELLADYLPGLGENMIRRSALATFVAIVLLTSQCFAQSNEAKNITFFMGDGTGVSSLNAASIYGYNEPRSLYIQSFPGVALADTSTATQWVTDSGASATGVKTNNGVFRTLP
jgi:alkaline phosphatase